MWLKLGPITTLEKGNNRCPYQSHINRTQLAHNSQTWNCVQEKLDKTGWWKKSILSWLV